MASGNWFKQPFNLTPLERKKVGELAKKGEKYEPEKKARVETFGFEGFNYEYKPGEPVFYNGTPRDDGVVWWGRRGGTGQVFRYEWDGSMIREIKDEQIKEKKDDRTAAEKWADDWEQRNSVQAEDDPRDAGTSHPKTA